MLKKLLYTGTDQGAGYTVHVRVNFHSGTFVLLCVM